MLLKPYLHLDKYSQLNHGGDSARAGQSAPALAAREGGTPLRAGRPRARPRPSAEPLAGPPARIAVRAEGAASRAAEAPPGCLSDFVW